jgi:ABC-type glycerol-3-phosphate transport system permease component
MSAINGSRIPHRRPAARPAQGLTFALLLIVAAAVTFPLLASLSIALQGPTVSPALLPDLTRLDFNVFAEVFRTEPALPRWIFNSFFVASVVTAGVLVTSALAAYALSHPGFAGKSLFLFICLGTLMIPFEATIIPNFLLVSGWGWRDSYQGLIMPFLASAFGIFLLRQYFLSIPRELYEAAQMDGCGRFRYLWSILVPLSTPALATLAVYTFLSTYNQYYWPLLITDNTVWRTTQVGITIFRNAEYQVFNLQLAANLIVMLPTLLLLVIGQKQLVRGLTAGAVKG